MPIAPTWGPQVSLRSRERERRGRQSEREREVHESCSNFLPLEEGTMRGKIGACRSGGDHSQLLQISKDTKRIDQMIDSWSKSPTVSRKSGDTSSDLLLKGALDLQESLFMLEKIQRSSDSLIQSKRGIQTNSLRERKHSGSPEMKNVIRESLYKKNLPSNGGRERIFSPVEEKKKPRAPNLVARLMGLEEAPPMACDPRKKYLDDIIESMKVKGLLGETLTRRRNPNACLLEEPPIVIIKPAIKGPPLHELPLFKVKLEDNHKSEKPKTKKRSETKRVYEREISILHPQPSPSPITRTTDLTELQLRTVPSNIAERSRERSSDFSHPAWPEVERESTPVVKMERNQVEEEEKGFRRRLEKDLKGNHGGAWNSGWAEIPSKEEARELVRQLENHLFNLLVLELTRK